MTDQPQIALCFLVRARDDGVMRSVDRFVRSYRRLSAGIDHRLYVVLKGFDDANALAEVRSLLTATDYTPVAISDEGLDLTAYAAAARHAAEQRICFVNTHTEILCDHWLAKLANVLDQTEAGVVGATGSFESLQNGERTYEIFPAFPNVHLRSNAFMIDRQMFCELTDGIVFASKMDAYLFESGPQSMTRRILDRGLQVYVVGRNGRGYSPRWWPTSDTFRQGEQSNLLVADNQTRWYHAATWPERYPVVQKTWGAYLQEGNDLATIRQPVKAT